MDFKTIERWFSGKALATLRMEILPLLYLAAEQGYWPKGASRKVCAALNKQAVAVKFARAHDRRHSVANQIGTGLLSDVCDNRKEPYNAELRGWDLVHSMMFGQFMRAGSDLARCDLLVGCVANDAERAALATARQWAADFAPVAELVAQLDSRRAPPVLHLGTLSPLVLGNVGRALGVDLQSIRQPEFRKEWVRRTIKGKEVEVAKITIIWPEGTRHGVSRFAGASHCEACGHAIRNGFNWVPLVADTAGGPISLWVGQDCARNLFGCEVEGEAEYGNLKAA